MKIFAKLFLGIGAVTLGLAMLSGCEQSHSKVADRHLYDHEVEGHEEYVFPVKGAPHRSPRRYGTHEIVAYTTTTDHKGHKGHKHKSHKHLFYHCKLAEDYHNGGHLCNTFGQDVDIR